MKTFLLFLVVAGNALAGEIVRGPYLQMPEANGITVVWRAKDSTKRVDFGLSHDCNDGHATAHKDGNNLVANLTGLLPGTNYFYRVEGQTFSMRTPRKADQPYRFAIIGDFGTATANAAAIAKLVNGTECDFLLTVGDNVYPSGERKLYDPHWFKPYAPTMSRVPCFPTLGNHDVKTENGKPFVDYFCLPTNGPAGLLERNYSYDYGNAHFVAIDSNPFENKQKDVAAKITNWVRLDLAATKQPWKFAYWHHPGHTSTGNHDECALIRDELLPVLEAAGVQMVFCGHNHFYERIKPINGIVTIITGGGGQELQKVELHRPYSAKLVGDRFSYTVVEIAGSALSLRQIDGDGKTVDEFGLNIAPAHRIGVQQPATYEPAEVR